MTKCMMMVKIMTRHNIIYNYQQDDIDDKVYDDVHKDENDDKVTDNSECGD